MKTENFISISLAYACGVAAAGFVEASLLSAALSVLCAGLLLFLLSMTPSASFPLILAEFFVLGAATLWARELLDPWFLGPCEWLSASAHAPRESFRGIIDSLPFPHRESNALVKALLSGDRASLPYTTLQAFRTSGAAHMLALSGLHLGILATTLRRCLSVLGNSRVAEVLRAIIVVLSSFAYMILCGAGASLQRAFLYILLRSIAGLSPGRKGSPLGTLCFALTFQLMLEPSALKTLSFQLSYLSMLGICLFYPILDGFYPSESRYNPLKRIWSAMALSLSCQLTTAPLTYITFGTFPWLFLLTNLLALPVCEALITFSALTLLLHALGLCPHILITVTDGLSGILTWSIEVISQISVG